MDDFGLFGFPSFPWKLGTWCNPQTRSWYAGHSVPGHWSSEYNQTQTTICTLAVNSAVWLTKQSPGELSELPAPNKHTNTHIQKRSAASQSSLRCLSTVRDNEEDKTHHINYPANTFSRGPVNHCAEAFLRTSTIPVGVPRHSWVLNLGSLKIACQQHWLMSMWKWI